MNDYHPLLDSLFHALSDPTRRAMLRSLAGGEHSVGELAAPFDISLAAASKHIRSLERAGLVTRTVQGRTHRCALDPRPLVEAEAFLCDYARFRQAPPPGDAGTHGFPQGA